MKKNIRNVLLYIGIPVILIMSYLLVSNITAKTEKVEYYEIIEKLDNNEISEFELNLYSGKLTYKLRGDKSGKEYSYSVANPNFFYNDTKEIINRINSDKDNIKKDKIIKYDYKSGGQASWLASLAPTLILVAVIVIFGFVMMRGMGSAMGNDKAMSFGKAKIKKADDRKKTTFADVAGADEEKEEMAEIVDFLKDPKKFNELGARIPKGVLLVGPRKLCQNLKSYIFFYP